PYFEAWTGESPAALAAQSGAKHLTMAFLQTATPGSCTPYWNGDTSMPIAQSTFGADFDTIQANGGDVIP
ncbi:chitinase, partial [Streptomyces sp. SID5926]|nr:chitinase [Streptomyces sp. SID5926]